MKLPFYLLLLISLNTSAQSLLPRANWYILADFELRDRVETVKITNYEPMDTIPGDFQWVPVNNDNIENGKYFFSKQGWVMNYEEYDFDSLYQESLFMKRRILRDKNGNIIKEEEIWPSSPMERWETTYKIKNGLILKSEYYHDNNVRIVSHVTEYIHSNGRYTTKKEYRMGQLIKETRFSYTENPFTATVDYFQTVREEKKSDYQKKYKHLQDSDSLIFQRRYSEVYDDKGRIIRFNRHTGMNDSLEYYEVTTFSKSGQVISAIKYKTLEKYPDSVQLSFEQYYEYNMQGDEIKWTQKSYPGEKTSITTYEYKYDDRGNWTEKIVSYDGIPDYRETREITYYR